MISCDVLCAGFGLVPNTELARLVGCVVSGTAWFVVDERQATTVSRDVFCGRRADGDWGRRACARRRRDRRRLGRNEASPSRARRS